MQVAFICFIVGIYDVCTYSICFRKRVQVKVNDYVLMAAHHNTIRIHLYHAKHIRHISRTMCVFRDSTSKLMPVVFEERKNAN